MPDRARWLPESAWSDLDPFAPSDRGALQVDVFEAEAIATIATRRGRETDVARLAAEFLGAALPTSGRASVGADCDLVWSAPGQWLAVATKDVSLADLSRTLVGVATVVDQSDSRGLVRVSGPKAREVLMKGFAIDLHPSAFSTGSSALTKVAHLSVQIWQVDAAPTYTIAVPRSFAGSFRSWLGMAYAPYALSTASL